MMTRAQFPELVEQAKRRPKKKRPKRSEPRQSVGHTRVDR
jgi:hypothetical protein